MIRCKWALGDPELQDYHDKEWGVPSHDDRRLFEFLVLEGAQAGLNWLIILKKRTGYRRAFASFNPRKVSDYSRKDVDRLLKNPDIVRNELKINAAITNAKKLLEIQDEYGSFDEYVWKFVGGRTIQHKCRSLSQVPVTSDESDAMSKELQKRGFKFVGSTICYSFMQAVGMVNDHVTSCYRYDQV